jgi:hypothetical protein
MPLDALVGTSPCTLLKIDVEGFEMQVLEGATKLIQREHPKIAIAAYHHENDLIDLANKMMQLYPEYRLYLRSYLNFQEMVLYAIP